jgi:hypothetical protein
MGRQATEFNKVTNIIKLTNRVVAVVRERNGGAFRAKKSRFSRCQAGTKRLEEKLKIRCYSKKSNNVLEKRSITILLL